ncbi:MAG: O-antigen ligase family protein [Prevotellaceae bacterium]|jgi:O-antigen ligase|nr:O-antigen ligase family protein [Prevotellaceae bacterium]
MNPTVSKNHTLKILEWATQCAVILLILAFPFRLPYRMIPLILLFICATVEWIVKQSWKHSILTKRNGYFLLMLLLFLLSFVYYPFEHPYPDFKLLVEHRLSLLGFGLLGFSGILSRINRKTIYYSIIGSGLLVVACIVCIQLWQILFQGEYHTFITIRQEYINYHMGFDFSLNLGLVACGCLWMHQLKTRNTKKNLLILLPSCLFIVVLLGTEGRSGFIMSVLLTGFLFLYFLYTRSRIFFWIACLLTLPIAFYGISSHSRMGIEKIKSEPRIPLFENALTLIKAKPLLGYGMQGAQFYTDSIRHQRHATDSAFVNIWHRNEMVDCHNQYLQATLEYGVVGLALLLFLLGLPLFLVDKDHRLFTVLFIFLISFQSLLDVTLFVPEFGIMFGLIMALFLSPSPISTSWRKK